jgi:hypothetical protein
MYTSALEYLPQAVQEAIHTTGKDIVEDLFGRDEGKLNGQGRLSIPSKHRRLLPEEVVVAKSAD